MQIYLVINIPFNQNRRLSSTSKRGYSQSLLKSLVNHIRLSNSVLSTSLLSTVILIITIMLMTSAHAALTATTANTIEGSKPYLKLSDGTKLTSLNQLLGFSMWDGTYEADGVTKHMIQVDASMAGTAISMPASAKFNDVIALVTANGTASGLASSMQGDDDGDTGTPLGAITATWY